MKVARNKIQELERLLRERIVILDGAMGSDPLSSNDFWEKYPTIPAVRDHRVLGYAEDPMLHAGPRVGQSLEIIARKIHPEAWEREADR